MTPLYRWIYRWLKIKSLARSILKFSDSVTWESLVQINLLHRNIMLPRNWGIISHMCEMKGAVVDWSGSLVLGEVCTNFGDQTLASWDGARIHAQKTRIDKFFVRITQIGLDCEIPIWHLRCTNLDFCNLAWLTIVKFPWLGLLANFSKLIIIIAHNLYFL